MIVKLLSSSHHPSIIGNCGPQRSQVTGCPGAPHRAAGVQIDGRPPGLYLGKGHLGSRAAGAVETVGFFGRDGWNMVFFSRETGWKMLKKWGIDDGLMRKNAVSLDLLRFSDVA